MLRKVVKRVRVLVDIYPRSSWFIVLGVLAFLSIFTGMQLESIYGVGKAEPWTDLLDKVGGLLFLGLAVAAPLTLAHWAVSDD